MSTSFSINQLAAMVLDYGSTIQQPELRALYGLAVLTLVFAFLGTAIYLVLRTSVLKAIGTKGLAFLWKLFS